MTDAGPALHKIAVVDDEPRVREVLAMVLRKAGHEVLTFASGADLLAALEDRTFDLVFTDLRMPGLGGLDLARCLHSRAPGVPVIVLTAHGTVATALEAVRDGVYDFLEKPIENEVVRGVAARALDHSRLARENRRLRETISGNRGLDSILAKSPPMQSLLEVARRAARSTATLLLTGETGTGKEVLARALHAESPRVGGPFEAVNLEALNPGVIESELFGHEKGAFTGAGRARAGVLERAHRGTLLLDEIGEVDGGIQTKLLRVLQEREVTRVGGDASRAVDVRVLAATHRDLQAEVEAGRFREDLYYRLAVVPLHVPPLRERSEDILPLARLLLDRLEREYQREILGWSDEAGAWMLTHHWPGNVRELENTLERGVVLARGEVLELEDLRAGTGPKSPKEGADGTLQEALDEAAIRRIRAALTASEGRRVEAARQLGVERTTLYRLMKRYEIEG